MSWDKPYQVDQEVWQYVQNVQQEMPPSWVCGELGTASWAVTSWVVAKCTGPKTSNINFIYFEVKGIGTASVYSY